MSSSSPSSPEAPPTYEAIASHMVRYTAKLPGVLAAAADAIPLSGRALAPYEYTGCDYCLALAACFPTRCIDFSKLNWSQQPLAAQLRGNLEVFCEAATRLGLPDAPTRSLKPSALQPEPSCVMHHLKVQHWLYSLARRFPPSATAFDPVAIRAVQSWRQLGTPFLSLKRSRDGDDDGDEANNNNEGRSDGVIAINDPAHYCKAADDTPCLPAAHLRAVGRALAPTPAYTMTEPPEGKASGDAVEEEKENTPGTASLAQSGEAKTKPWLSYSKPWRLPAIEAANARRARAEAGVAKRKETTKKADPTANAFATGASSLREQFEASESAVNRLRQDLNGIRLSVLAEVLAGHDTLDFPVVAAQLKKIGITPDD